MFLKSLREFSPSSFKEKTVKKYINIHSWNFIATFYSDIRLMVYWLNCYLFHTMCNSKRHIDTTHYLLNYCPHRVPGELQSINRININCVTSYWHSVASSKNCVTIIMLMIIFYINRVEVKNNSTTTKEPKNQVRFVNKSPIFNVIVDFFEVCPKTR